VDSLPTPYIEIGGRRLISFCSNNYLGLNHRQEVKIAATAALNAYSHATSESRRLGGDLAILEQLEASLADFKQFPAAMITATGLLANIAAIHGVVDASELANRWYGSPSPDKRPTVIYDELSHRSIRMGAGLSRAERLSFRHNDIQHLAGLLGERQGYPTLVVTEGLFSMDGDLADLPALVKVCDHYGAVLMVDDAHGTGVYGSDGSGTVGHFGLSGKVPLQVVTLSKALGGLGGAVLSDSRTIAMLRTFSSGYRFTSSLPAEQAAATIAALHIIRSEPGVRARLWSNVRRLRAGLARIGFEPAGDGPIIPIIVGAPLDTAEIEEALLAAGYWCAAATPPAVPPDGCRIRITVSAMHAESHIDGLLTALNDIAPRLMRRQRMTSTLDGSRQLRLRLPE
jgi:8-amino-7-oxononanoate synthase